MCENVFSGRHVYSVRVYDNSPATDSTSAAYQHSQLIHIMGLHQPSHNTMSNSVVVITGTINICCLWFKVFS